MQAKDGRITQAQVAQLEKRVIAYWLEKYGLKKPHGKPAAEFDVETALGSHELHDAAR
jgi:hypothetical protein